MFPFVSLSEKAGAVLGPEGHAVVPVSAFVTSRPCCQFRYSRRDPNSTTTNIRIRVAAPIPSRDNVRLFIPRLPGCDFSTLEEHDTKSDVRLPRCEPSVVVHRRPPMILWRSGAIRLKRIPLQVNHIWTYTCRGGRD